MCFQLAIGSFGPGCFGQPSCRKKEEPNQSLEPTPKGFASRLTPFRNECSVFATTPCRGFISFSFGVKMLSRVAAVLDGGT
jgi:hypothetical protein